MSDNGDSDKQLRLLSVELFMRQDPLLAECVQLFEFVSDQDQLPRKGGSWLDTLGRRLH